MTKATTTEVRRRGIGAYVVRCALRGEVFELWRAGRATAVLMSVERAAALERAERELTALREP